MNLLALETSSEACSVAVERDGHVFERHLVRPKEHTRLLMPMIGEVLDEAALSISDLDAIVAGIGPGSFIGVRIAVSVAQGIAFGAGLGVVPVSSLAAVAAEGFAGSDAARIVVAQDAHMQEVYLARFVRGPNGRAEAVGDAALHEIAAVGALAEAPAGGWHAAGAGWRRHPAMLEMNKEWLAGRLEVEWPRARYLLPPAHDAVRAGGAIRPGELAPAYLRHEVAREMTRVPGRHQDS